jgi:hypothetical protein
VRKITQKVFVRFSNPGNDLKLQSAIKRYSFILAFLVSKVLLEPGLFEFSIL